MDEHHLHVRRTARYYTLGPTDAKDVWIVCHGYAQLARYFLRNFEPLDDGTRCIVAPEALSRYYFETAPGVHAADARIGATWMTREDRAHEIADYIAYLDTLASHLTGAAERRISALGFSQGAATVARWAAHGATRLDHVVLWGSGLPPELEPSPDLLRGADLTIAAGNQDEQIGAGVVARAEARMREGGMAYRLVRYDGGHRVDPPTLRTCFRI